MEIEKTHLLYVFEINGYNSFQGINVFLKERKGLKIRKELGESVSSVQLPFILGTANKIAQILRKHDVSSTFRPLNTIHNSLGSVKDLVECKNMKCAYLVP